ncbi:MAG: ribonuclease R [Muribaculaceae bacterium]
MAKNTNNKKTVDRIRLNIDTYIAGNPTGTFNYRQVAAALGLATQAELKHVAMYLAELAFDGILMETSPGKYRLPQRSTKAVGTFVRRSNGKNSVVTDDTAEEIFVAERNSMHALNGDRVEVTIAARIKGAEPEAEVVDIIERKEQTFIGILKVDRHFAYLLTDSKFLATDIYIPKSKLRGGKTGDKAVVRITDWPDDAKNPQGEVVDVLGEAGKNDTEINAIMAEFGLPYHYPETVEKAADKIDAGITDEVVAQREDLRDVTTFTIDPRDAKDFDDALSLRRLDDGNYEVGVHIADVTHYVHPDTIIDREAKDRATSIYLVDRVVPMLPEHLSNGICSLRPDEDKLTFSVLFTMTPEGKVLSHRIARTVTRSNRRFTYEEAQERIETGKGDYADEILTLDRMAKALRKARYDNGSVDFDRVEVRFDIDENGHPTSVFFKESKDANKLIEEFMLLANKVVAATIGVAPKKKKAKAFVYRVHDVPDPERLANLAELARVFGYKLKTKGTPKDINRSLNKMLADVKGKGEENFLSTLAIRSMAKAIYTTTNIGHYGLGFDYYTHFTSPIRRYPDMMVHRLLARYLAGGRSVNLQKLEDECKHSSDMEQLAASAERASIKYKQVEYMADHLGEVYTGVISGVTEWGLYVELEENKCEGLVPIRDLADDYYDFDDRNYCLVGRAHNHRYRLGDVVTVQVARADIQKKQLDLALVDEKNPPRTLEQLAKGQKSGRPTGEKVGNRKKKGRNRRR